MKKIISGMRSLYRAIFSLKGFACGMVIFVVNTILNHIVGLEVKDDDLYLPPENISDDENVMVALGEIVGICRDDDVLAGVDAALSTNECISAAIARAAKRPRYVNQLMGESLIVGSPCLDTDKINNLCRWFYGARHMIFLELKRYDDAIEDDRTLLELAEKIMNGRSCELEKLEALCVYSEVVDRLAKIARLDNVDERVLAEVDAILSKYEMKDWRHVCRQMVRGEYSYQRNILLKYAASPWSEQMKFLQTNGKKLTTWDLFVMNCIFNPQRSLSNHAERCRAKLSILDDYKTLVTNSKKRDEDNIIGRLTWKRFPISFDYSLALSFPLARSFVVYADVASYHRAFRLLVACRRHFIRTGKMPENQEDVSVGLQQEVIVDPSLGTPYEIKTWVDGNMAHAAVFRCDASGAIVALHVRYCKDESMADSRAEGNVAHICWPLSGLPVAQKN